MQYLLVDKNDTLMSISKITGSQNVDLLLNANGLERTPKVGEAWEERCNQIISQNPNLVTKERKASLLNNLTGSDELFEKACLMDDDEWKLFSSVQAFKDAMRVPETMPLPYSARVIGDTSGEVAGAYIGNMTGYVEPVSHTKYKAVMENLKTSADINPAIFNTVNTEPGVKIDSSSPSQIKTPQYATNLPWGKIQMYSSLLSDIIEFPAYPEQIDTERNATYTSMPDIIYQYEPWVVYQNSGPRTQSLSFHLHRDLWTGNHLDGNANKLIRFCEANTFPRYNGSAVVSPYVRFYIDGSLFISGVLVNTTVNWTGPLGLDNWYLEFTLSLTIQEVSETALNIDTVSQMGLIGG